MACIDLIPYYLTKYIGKLGRNVARFPFWFIVMSLLTAALFATGLQRMTYLTDTEVLFVPHGARGLDERNIVESYFNMDYQKYVQGHETNYFSGLWIIIVTKNVSQDSLPHHNGLLNHGKMIDAALNKLVVTTAQRENVTFEDVCARTHFSKGNGCQRNVILDVTNFKYLKYPVHTLFKGKEKFVVPSVLGDISLNGSSVKDASVLRLFYVLDKKKENARSWEKTAATFMHESHWKNESYQVFTVHSESLERELTENIHDSFDVLPLATGLLVCFMTMNGFVITGRKWKSQWNQLGLQSFFVFRASIGLIVAVMGTLCGWGLVMYTGLSWQSTNLASLFLLLGVGMDDAFVMLNSWKRMKETMPEESVEEKMQETYKDAAVSITITSMTNICSFAMGFLTPSFETVKIFCAYVTGGLVSIYILTLTFFGPFMVLANKVELHFIEKDEREQRAEEDPSQNVLEEAHPTIDGQNIVQPVSLSNPKPLLTDKMINLLIRFLQKPWIRILILIVWVGVTIFCSVKITYMREGLERNRITRYGSQAAMYFEAEDKYFRVMNFRIHVVIAGDNLDYGNEKVQEGIMQLLDDITDLPLTSNKTDLKEDWLAANKECEDKQKLKGDFKTKLVTCLERYAAKTPLRLNIKLSNDKSKITATRFMLQSEDVKNATMDMEFTRSLRQVADASSFNVTVFSPYFPFFDQYLQVWESTLVCLSISAVVVLVVTFLLIPNFKACIILCLTISSTIVQVGGFMVLWDINLDVVSMIELIMCVGFSVDFCAHICNHFYTSHQEEAIDVNEKIKESLSAYGPPIVQGAISTILGVLPMFYLSSYILQSFTKMVILVITLGALHGLMVLPALMTCFKFLF